MNSLPIHENSRSRTSPDSSNMRMGLLLGLLAVTAFSLTLPVTTIALQQLNPWFVGFSRSAIAGLLAAGALYTVRCKIPSRGQLRQLLIVAGGVVLGFPLCSAMGMETVPASHGGIMLGILPLMTAACGCYINHERNRLLFWVCGLLAALVVILYASAGDASQWGTGDSWLIFAVISAAWGYALGGRLSAQLGGWQVICWALVLSMPITLPMTLLLQPPSIETLQPSTWMALLYLALISQLLGFFAWNKALVLGGISRISQVQLLQPFMTIVASALLLNEYIDSGALFCGALVLALVTIGNRARNKHS
ncbi:MAG: DMT family transporter [Motiliproteus sp.]